MLSIIPRKIKGESIVQQIKREVIIDSIENKYEYITNNLTRENTINEFKHTPLSNFYGVNIKFKNKIYPSVEHAYLCQKYNLEDLKTLKVKFIRELNQIFKLKGINKDLRDFSNIFFDSDMPAGVVKRISNKLRNWGYQKETWDDTRLELMIELLLVKFKDYDLNHFLLATEGKYLVEGNTWKDTFWGISDEKSKNYLGRIIMNIREKYNSGKLEKPQKPRKWFARFMGKS